MNGDSLFTQILDFPLGFTNKFSVSAEGKALGTFGPGESVDFLELLGHGVSTFTITGIAPLVDSEDPLGFPIKLAFDTPTAEFVMVGVVPEPSTYVLVGTGALCLIASAARRGQVRVDCSR